MGNEITAERLQWAIRFGSWGLGSLALLTGLILILQDDPRMGSPGWQIAFSTGLGPTFWGTILAVAGFGMLVAILFGDRGNATLGGWAIVIGVVIFGRGAAALIALFSHPEASGTAPPFFFAISFVYLVHGLIHLPALTDQIARTARQVVSR